MNDQIKDHFDKHRNAYILAATLVGGVIVGKILFGRAQIINNTAVASPVVNAVANATNGGYMHKIVKCMETGQMWETVKEAAEAMKVSPSMMSKHLNGHKDHISELHFTIVGLGSGL